MTRRPLVALAVAATTVLGTAGMARAAPVDPFGYVRLLHGDLGVAGRPVEVAVDGDAAGRAPWAGASPWRPVTPGRHRVAATGGTDIAVDVGAGCGITVVTGQGDLTRPSPRPVVIPDCSPARLGPGQARVTAVVVASPAFGPVEVEINGGRQRVEPHTLVPGTVVKAGDVRISVRQPGTGVVYLRRDVRLEEGTASTLALVGGGEAGVTLAVVEDATQARAVPAPGQAIHTGPGGRAPLLPLAVVAVLGTALLALRQTARRALTVALVAAGLVLAGCGRHEPAVAPPPPPGERPRSPNAPAMPPSLPAPPAPAPPSATPPAVLRIPSLGLEFPVGGLDGVTGLPRSLPLGEVAWLTGTSPAGAIGTTAILGHTGSGAFGRLGLVRPGEEITVTDAAGQPHTYKAVSVSAHRKESFPQEIWAPQRVPTLVLITCTGGRNPTTGLHLDNLIVRAVAA